MKGRRVGGSGDQQISLFHKIPVYLAIPVISLMYANYN
jgi:hypothetical protein